MQVPENNTTKVVLSESEQLDLLRKKLSGNQVFGACRGNLGWVNIGDNIAMMTEHTPSPTACLAAWDAFVSQPRAMVNLLAQFKRDGHTYAFKHLLNALSKPDYLLPGETIPVEKTEPITVLMLDPKRTILLLRWLVEREGHWMDLNSWLDIKDNREPESRLGMFANKLFKAFPTLEQHTRARRREGAYEGPDVVRAWYEAVYERFPKRLTDALKPCASEAIWGQWNDHLEDIQDIPFVYVIRGEQSKILKLFSRKDQRRIATWQINVPVQRHEADDVTMYPETFESEYVKAHPHVQSLGASHGYKMMLSTLESRDDSKTFGRLGCNHGVPGKYGIRFQFPIELHKVELKNSGTPTR